jgi:hypothetical protein
MIPIELMQHRVDRHGSDSDTSCFTELLYLAELVLKLTTAAFVAGIQDDREGHRYRLLHTLIRSDGLGSWSKALDEALTGPASQHLSPALSQARQIFTIRVSKGAWQYDAVAQMDAVLRGIRDDVAPVGDKTTLKNWFQLFAEVRNKTRGHGATTAATCSKLLPALQDSVRMLCENNPIFEIPWAYLHRNLSGKYRVIPLSGDASAFSQLKSSAASTGANYPAGVYLSLEKFTPVELVRTDLDVTDFYLPNGGFSNGTFELHSLITDNRQKGDGTPYLAPASERPGSETEGLGVLEVFGEVFANLPAAATGYVRRPELEREVTEALTNDRHPIVTLVGRGGIGKTSVALNVLKNVAATSRFSVMVWFSARDIDLLPSGAKPVQPRHLTERDIADEYYNLIKGDGGEKVKDTTSIASEHLRSSPLGPTLFVFDNFETVRSPVDLFSWIDTNIRLPNKALITSRFREFKADYPIGVGGMEHDEATALVSQTVRALKIEDLVGTKEREAIIEESNGHPYVIKIILGEIASRKAYEKPSRLIARKDDILDALFERTYASLSPMASKIFLTLSGWRSLVPQLAVEAVSLRHGSEGGDPESAIDELVRMSLIERTVASDDQEFLEVPLTAALFGRRKLEVSPVKAVIETDIRFLQDIGTTVASGLKDGVRPRIEAFFRKAARRIAQKTATLDEMRPVLEFLARGYPPAWMLISELEQENADGDRDRAAEAVRRYLESKPPENEARAAWQELVKLYRASGDAIGGCGAFLQASEAAPPPLNEVSSMANWLNNAPEVRTGMDVSDRKAVFRPLARLLEQHLPDASATDLSRLAWLHLHSGNTDRALEVAELGLDREPGNLFCEKLVVKLST